jgi:hypothetical protein
MPFISTIFTTLCRPNLQTFPAAYSSTFNTAYSKSKYDPNHATLCTTLFLTLHSAFILTN